MGRVRKVPPRLTPDLWNELVDDYVSQTEEGYKQTIPTQLPCSYVIWKDNGTVRARNGLTGKIDFQGTDANAVIQSAIDALTNGGTIFLKEIQLPSVTYGNNILIIEEYRGQRKVYSNQGKFINIPFLSSDPDTTGWGDPEKGRRWFNTSVNKIKIWDGSKILTIPASEVGGAGMQSGRVTIEADTVGMKTGTVLFTIPFGSPPSVQTSIENPTPPIVDWGRVFARNITTTQFEYVVEIMLAQPGGKVDLVWQTQV